MKANTTKWTARATAVFLAISAIVALPTQANAAVLSQANLFNPNAVTSIELEIPDASASSLNTTSTAKNYVNQPLPLSDWSRSSSSLGHRHQLLQHQVVHGGRVDDERGSTRSFWLRRHGDGDFRNVRSWVGQVPQPVADHVE